MAILKLNSKGFTLVEMLCATVVSLIGIFAMLQAMEVITQTNVMNQMREMGVKVADEKMKNLQEAPFVETVVQLPYSAVYRDNRRYLVRPAINALSDNSRELVVRVSWAFKNVSSYHEVRSIKSR